MKRVVASSAAIVTVAAVVAGCGGDEGQVRITARLYAGVDAGGDEAQGGGDAHG